MSVAVIGAGSFGTALACCLAAPHQSVRLWGRSPDVVDEINRTRRNSPYLGDTSIPGQVRATTDLGEALAEADCVILATPSHFVRTTLGLAVSHLARGATLVCAAKGIEIDTLMLMPAVVESALGARADVKRAYLSGPSFAKEVARGLPTSVVIAASDEGVASAAQQRLSTSTLRCYTSTDVAGVEIAGAIKNVYAIAAGAIEARGLGHNARAALITRGLNEMALLGLKLGARPLTFAGLAGVGDLVLTCTGDLSRNRQVGLALGQGTPADRVTRDMRQVAEGVRTAKAVHLLAARHEVDMPIAEQIYRVLYEAKPVAVALRELASRELKPEWPTGIF